MPSSRRSIDNAAIHAHPGASPYGQQSQPQRENESSEEGELESSRDDSPIDDPGDAQRSSKSEPDGDGEETES